MIECKNIRKSFDGKVVLDHVNLELEDNRIYCLMGPSGRGKTTLLRILADLETLDEGHVTGVKGKQISMVFQENRLCEGITAVENIRLVGCRNPEALLSEILPESCLKQPVHELSGGMKRRVAVARAVAAESNLILMDEPFTGLDEETKRNVVNFILKYRKGRFLLITTHQDEDVSLLGAEKILI